jgi:hypothetical protein
MPIIFLRRLWVLMLMSGMLFSASCKAEEKTETPTPAQAESTTTEPESPASEAAAPVAIIPPPLPEMYSTYELGAEGKAPTGCLWRLPSLRQDGLEIYAALSLVNRPGVTEPFDLQMQLAGAKAQDMVVQSAVFTEGQLTSGTAFDTRKIALETNSDETLRVRLPADQLEALIDSMAKDGAKVDFRLKDDDNAYSFDMPAPSAEAVKEIRDCVTKVRTPTP